MCSRILVPYDHERQLQVQLSEALPLATRLSAELVLLRVNLPQCPETGCADYEQLFSELKGLQAQLPSVPITISVETSPGPAEQAIFEYAQENAVDLIVAPHLTLRQPPARRPAAAHRQPRAALPVA